MATLISHLQDFFLKRTIFFKILAVMVLLTGMGHFYDFQKNHRRQARTSEQLDFPAYYLAQKIAKEGDNVYSLSVIRQAAEKHRIDFKIFRANLYSPPFYLFMLPLPEMEMHQAQTLFVSFKALLMFLIVLSLAIYINGMDQYKNHPLRPYRTMILTGVGLFVLPLLNPLESDFMDGQINVITLATLVGALYLERKYPLLSGLALTFGAVVKLSPAFLGLKLILEKRWKLLISALASGLFLIFLSVLYFSYDTVEYYFTRVLFGFMVTDQIPLLEWPINHTLNQSFKGLFYRLFISNFNQDLGGTAVVYYNPLLGKSLTLLTNGAWIISCILITRYVRTLPEDRWKSSLHFSYYVAVMTMVSPLTWYHHQVVLILPLLVVLYYCFMHPVDSLLILVGAAITVWLFYFPPMYLYGDLLSTWNDLSLRGFSALYYIKLLANILLALLIYLALRKEKQRVPSAA